MKKSTIRKPTGHQKIYLNDFIKRFKTAKNKQEHDKVNELWHEISMFYTFVERNYIYTELRNG